MVRAEHLLETLGDREISLTMAFARLLSRLLRDAEIGDLIVPIVPDEARTFGMEALFRQVGIYAHAGQQYEPVDHATLLSYREAEDGQVLEEGITEAGSMASFIAAGTAHATRGINTIPFFIFYSMFGFQRVGDLIWAAADSRCRGFLLGGTAGRTTLAGEGLQHQDGQSHLLAYLVPNLLAYDPAYAYELAVIIEDGIRRMYVEGESVFYHLTVENQPYGMPKMPDGAREGILRGLYRLRPAKATHSHRAQLLASGAILREALDAQTLLEGLRRRRRCLERDELGPALPRRARVRPVEHAAPARAAAPAVCHPVSRRRVGCGGRSERLSQGAARLVEPVAQHAAGGTRHRWVRAQRHPRGAT